MKLKYGTLFQFCFNFDSNYNLRRYIKEISASTAIAEKEKNKVSIIVEAVSAKAAEIAGRAQRSSLSNLSPFST